VQPILNEIHEYARAMARIGGNLNQISHAFNITETINEADLKIAHEELQIKFKEISTHLKKIQYKLFDERGLML
jgi:hypothetical protein